MDRAAQFLVGWGAGIALLLGAAAAQGAQPDPTEGLCRDFPQNSRCVNRSAAQDGAAAARVREFKLMLHEVPGSSEWVRIEQQGVRYRVVHSRCLQSEVTRFLAIAAPFPPFFSWYDHAVARVTFAPDGCSAGDGTCTRTAAGDTLALDDVEATQGTFSIEYAEGGFSRTVHFRLPGAAGQPPEDPSTRRGS